MANTLITTRMILMEFTRRLQNAGVSGVPSVELRHLPDQAYELTLRTGEWHTDAKFDASALEWSILDFGDRLIAPSVSLFQRSQVGVLEGAT